LNVVSSYILATTQLNTLNMTRNVDWVQLLSLKLITRVPKALAVVWRRENTQFWLI